ncbi:MAG TPA: hypothetical protein VFE65_03545 [Pseudonocardia sp.]|jgi:hypothetical protein|nr:hypothetical protein [Pseudonocardia sp.]
MGWLPSVVLIALGLVVLVLVLLAVFRRLRRLVTASRRLSTSVAGRTLRVRAGVAETRAWREARHAPNAEL